jgi:hypothetical protein
LPSPSPYFQASLSRFKARGALIRRDVEIMLEGIHGKSQFLGDLRRSVRQHREEDSAQLSEARLESWSSWEERLKRVKEWMASASQLASTSAKKRAWRDSALDFDRANNLSQKFASTLATKAAQIEKKLVELGDKRLSWSGRLGSKEIELREFVERQAVKTTEILVSKARKQPFLDFVYREREEEGRLATAFKNVRSSANRALERIARAETWASQKAETNPAIFEIRKNLLLEAWQPARQRLNGLRDAALQQALDFEEGRRRLRWMYDQVQQMRVVEESTPQRRPLLERLFSPSEDK